MKLPKLVDYIILNNEKIPVTASDQTVDQDIANVLCQPPEAIFVIQNFHVHGQNDKKYKPRDPLKSPIVEKMINKYLKK